jgi:2-dehydro-3-deoxy-L-rhamnonate dehydrogenase (NAD+)
MPCTRIIAVKIGNQSASRPKPRPEPAQRDPINRYDLNDRVAVITGGAQGFGLATAQRMAASSAKVVLWRSDGDLAKSAAQDLGEDAMAFQVDVTDADAVSSAVSRQTTAAFGAIDFLVCAAGIAGPNAPVPDYPLVDWQAIMDINVTGVFHCSRTVPPQMQAAVYGRVVNIASVAGKEGNPGAGPYSASKAAVIGLAKSLGKENAEQDIAVNCVTPAAAKTRIVDQMSEEHIAFMLSKTPRGRFVDVAGLLTWPRLRR